MTETGWLACDDPTPMLEFLGGKASERKLRLFACACLRRVWHLLSAAKGRRIVVRLEDFVDGRGRRPRPVRVGGTGPDPRETAEKAARFATAKPALIAATGCYNEAADAVAEEVIEAAHSQADEVLIAANAAGVEEQKREANLLRCLFGNPFRPVTFDPALRTPTVAALAQAAYEERQLPAGTLDPQRLGVLADALEEAGADAAIVDHLRGDGPHVRGCHVVDLVLGRS
jgi:hypothetical protein